MSIIQSIILGIIQGITEFLPISSTAHLTLAGKFMGVISPDHPELWTAYMAVIQLGTLAAVIVYFRNDIVHITSHFVEEVIVSRKPYREQSHDAKLGWMITLGTLPVAIIGLSLRKIIEGSLTKDLWVLTFSVLFFALLLWLAERVAKHVRTMEEITLKDSIIIGFAQAFALFPGASRSGTTITGGLFVGLNREAAARYSFLLSIPAVFASGMLELKEALQFMSGADLQTLLIGTVVAFIFGYWAIGFLLKYLKTHSTYLFIYYRLALGAVMVILLVSKLVQP
ncbi:MAG TPA: undecaprenyl-diphosphatase UppP [Candidatus Kapabacteria bacterium]|nr:undecaprenyl-diphosphatase UppP [Candidatus Kapabacteria bacterium]